MVEMLLSMHLTVTVLCTTVEPGHICVTVDFQSVIRDVARLRARHTDNTSVFRSITFLRPSGLHPGLQ